MRNYAKLLLRELGYELTKVSKLQPSLITFLESRDIDVVLDVGANRGQFGKTLRRQGYRGEIVSFEPVNTIFAELQETAARFPPWRVFNFGLSDRAGEAEINISEMTEFSSLHRQTAAAMVFDARARVMATQRIVLKRLDEITDEFVDRNSFLKIDTQGHEKQVLDGAGSQLRGFRGIQIELPITPIYESPWALGDAFAYMSERGFMVCQMTGVNKTARDVAAFVDIDVVFVGKIRGWMATFRSHV